METISRGFLKLLGFGVAPPVVMGSEEYITRVKTKVKAKTITRMKVPVRIDYAARGEPEDCDKYGSTSSMTLGEPLYNRNVGPTEWDKQTLMTVYEEKMKGKDATRT